MTLQIQKGTTNYLSLSNILVNSIYASRTYRMDFTSDQTNIEQSLVVSITQDGNRFDFQIVEGTDITLSLVGFYTWELYEVNGSDNLLCSGKVKVIDTRTEPTTPTILDTPETYVVANGGQ